MQKVENKEIKSVELSRDMLKNSYRAYKEMCYLIIELIRQFYIAPRVLRISNDEFLPFDNSLLVLEYRGADILALADAIAKKGGESVAGITLIISEGKALNVKVGGEEVDTTRVYKVVSTDYLSWGNDQLEPLANYIKSTPLNMMMRDAMFDYVTCATIKGEKISAKLDNRIIIK